MKYQGFKIIIITMRPSLQRKSCPHLCSRQFKPACLWSPNESLQKTDAERRFADKVFHTREPATATLRVRAQSWFLEQRSILSADRMCRLSATVVTD